MDRLLYNVTVRIGHEKHDEWVAWMRTQHIPEVMATDRFESWRMHRMLGDESDDGVTYAIGYVARSKADFDSYQLLEAPTLQQAHESKYKGYYGAFRSVMEIIDEG